MAKAKYVVINIDEMLPVGAFSSQKASIAAGESCEAENFDVLSKASEMQKAYKGPEMLRLFNSIQGADDAVKNLGTKAKAAEATFTALLANDYEENAPEAKEGKSQKAGRKNTSKKLDNAIISYRKDGFSHFTTGSIRRQVYEALIKYQGKKGSVNYTDFVATLDEDVQKKMAPAMRYLARFGWVDVQIEVDGDLVEWMEISKKHKEAFDARKAKQAEAKSAKAAAKKAKKAVKKAKEKDEDDEEESEE